MTLKQQEVPSKIVPLVARMVYVASVHKSYSPRLSVVRGLSNKNIFGQYKSLRVPFNEDVIPLLKKTDGSLRFRAWPHRETHGRADIIVEIDRIDPHIRVSSMKFNKFFGNICVLQGPGLNELILILYPLKIFILQIPAGISPLK